MTIKRFLVLSGSLFGIATVTLIISLIVLSRSEQTINETQKMNHMSLLLAEELRESSRGLTASVEKFVVTGEVRHYYDYVNIVNVRSGRKPRPSDKEIAPGRNVPLNVLMRQANFTEQEMKLLHKAEELSDKLIILEMRAINAARGKYPDSDGNYTINGEPDMQFARDLIFSSEYEEEVGEIMQPINEFYELLRTRLDKSITKAQIDFDRSLRLVWTILGIFVSMFIAFVLLISVVIIRPILMCDTFAKSIAGGTLDTSLYYESRNEIGSLADSLRIMVKSLLERMQLEEHARYFDAVIAAADAGVVISDKNYKITDWNAGAERILGYTASEITGETAKAYSPESSHSEVDGLHRRLAGCEHIAHMETIRKHKDGRIINCSASYTPIIGSDGSYEGTLSIFHDITDAKLAEQQTRNLAAIVEIVDAGIVIKDKNGVVIEWNSGAENILGYAPEDIIGKTTHYYAPEEAHAGIDDMEEYLRAGKSIMQLDVIRKRKDGEIIDCSSSYTPIFDEHGEFAGSVAVFHDISDKKRLERELKHAISVAEEKHSIIISGIDYASKIQRSLLPSNGAFEKVFKDYSVLWKPRDIVGGDIYWLKTFDKGTVLCVCDCTGHGTPGALLTMLVVSAFESIINEDSCKDTAQIMFLLDQRLSSILKVNETNQLERGYGDVNDGCDIAVLFIAKDGGVSVSSGNTHVFVCDGEKTVQIKGQRLFVGEGGIKCADDVAVTSIPANSDNKFYIASDGLFDQIGGEFQHPFGYRTFKKIILENHDKELTQISQTVWEAFEDYRGSQPRRDDAQMITFRY